MEHRFDQISKVLASGQSRRRALQRLGGGLLATLGLGKARAFNDDEDHDAKHKCKEYCEQFPRAQRMQCRSQCMACGGVVANLCFSSTNCSPSSAPFCCAAGTSCCSGACTDLQNDINNCGSCGNVCPAGSSCISGACQAQCHSAETLCNGICVDLSTDATNCGSCGKVCANGLCVGGVCTCTAGLTLCASSCVNTSTDSQNCGTCGTVCVSGTCVSGACTGGSTHLVINEFQTAGRGGASDEFIELFNGGNASLNLNNYKLVYRSAAGTTDVTLAQFTSSHVIQAGAFFLVAGPAYLGSADVTYSPGMLAEGGGGLAVRDPNGNIVDSVGYGTATNSFVETSPALAPPSGQSVGRCPNGSDTNNNSLDFKLFGTPTPRAQNC